MTVSQILQIPVDISELWHNLCRFFEVRLTRLTFPRQTESDRERLLSEEENYGTTTVEDRTGNQTSSQTLESPQQRIRANITRLPIVILHSWLSKWAYFKQFRILIPYIWPSKDWKTQLSILVMILMFVKDRVLRVLIPRQVGDIMDSFQSGSSDQWAIIVRVCYWVFLETAYDFKILEAVAMTRVSQVAIKNIIGSFQAHILSLSRDFFRTERSAELLTALQDGEAVSRLIEELISTVIPLLADLVIAMIYLYYTISGYVALNILLLIASYSLVAYYGVSWVSPPYGDYVEKHREMRHDLQDLILNWPAISCFNRHDHENSRFSKTLDEFLNIQSIYYMRQYLVSNAQVLLLKLALVGVAFTTTRDIIGGVLSPSSFAVLFTYWINISRNLTGLTESYRTCGEILISAEKLVKIFHSKPTIIGGRNRLQIHTGNISFEGVSFQYEGQVTGVQDIDFRVLGGSTVALVGESGGGKSTLANLFNRFDDVNKGTIKIDGQDIRGVTLFSLRDAIGVVHQDPFIFNRSIVDNVRYGRLDATDDEVTEVCKAVGIHDSIMKFKEKYEKKAGERANQISGGQKQRIEIARVLLSRPKVIVLDEPTSAVDFNTEAKIREAFDNLGYPHTTLIIAHRLLTIKDADLILVLHEGRIKEMGSHSELMTQRGRYHELWSSQSKLGVKPPAERDM